MKRRSFCAIAATLGWARAAIAQPTSGPVTIVVSFAPGGSGDITARLIGQFWREAYGVTVVVQTKPGANGIVGLQAAKNGPADGKTLVLATTSTLCGTACPCCHLPFCSGEGRMSVHYLEDTASAMFSAQIAALASGNYFCVRSARGGLRPR